MAQQVLVLAGLWNSGPAHWQSQWQQQRPDWRRVEHSDWETPDAGTWVAELDAAIGRCAEPPVLVAHSLSCALITRWAASGSQYKAAGAFLVAPSDTDAPTYPDCTTGFQPMQLAPLPFPTLIVASSNDPYVDITRARQFASAWGSTCIEIGNAGHINGDAGYGPWPEGLALFDEFCAGLGDR
ncbi:alpha/beta hydrolase [Duganella sp. Leaf126]|uniref:RBBP9/YdeN family alpha/beta hydrolase n=1 Tax=Duganella sp. Leaf126 TaxID=1736266 RepID=UPI0006FA92D2|nr:alpha/beta hydrolase [Duganella sp. Leaf126]KQQ39980.1 alpha/beta hydrolase [Duganella sp. Leaf126]